VPPPNGTEILLPSSRRSLLPLPLPTKLLPLLLLLVLFDPPRVPGSKVKEREKKNFVINDAHLLF